jgi:hypothetical protein
LYLSVIDISDSWCFFRRDEQRSFYLVGFPTWRTSRWDTTSRRPRETGKTVWRWIKRKRLRHCHASFARLNINKEQYTPNECFISLTLSYSSEGSPALAVFRHH